MIVEHETFVRRDYTYAMNRPLDTAKFLLENAFGITGNSRPVFRSIESGIVKMVNDNAIFNLGFGPINYNYIDSLPLEDISVFSDQDFGHYFYEFGRSILSITAMTMSRVEWFIQSKDQIPELDNYYYSFLKLNDKLEGILNEFKKNMEIEDEDIEFDFVYVINRLKELYEESGNYKDAPDIQNKEMILFTYIGLLFAILGTLLTLSSQTIDSMSYLKSMNASSVDSILKSVFEEAPMDDEFKSNLIKFLFLFNCITTLYRNTSGIKKHDRIFETIQTFTTSFFKRIQSEEDIEFLADISDLMKTAKGYDIFNEINNFTSALPSCDNADIWSFGFEYIRGYKVDKFEENPDLALDFYQPQIKSYLDNTLSDPKDLDIEKGFNFVIAILNNLDNNKITTVDPKTILVLTVLGSAFRKIEKRSSISSNSIVADKVHSAIDLIDVIIVNLYNLWFKSGKFFKQPKRPHYCNDGAESTLNLLKCETNQILLAYTEFVRFGNTDKIYKSDETLFKTYFKTRMLADCKKYGCSKFITEELFTTLNQDVFIRECATRGCRSLTYSVLVEDNNENSLQNLISNSVTTELPKSVIRTFANTKNENLTGIDVLDKVIYSMPMIKDYIQENPYVYMLGVYCVMLDMIQKIFEANNVGNYFDFGKAEAAIDTYKLDSIVSELILKPAKKIEDGDLL